MLITEEYKQLNAEMHKNKKDYGTTSKSLVQPVYDMCERIGTYDVLDYGCGKSCLARELPFEIQQYDPAIKKFSREPYPADIVVCTDVLEHIEPECLEDVLDHLKRLTRLVGMFTIATREANKTLPDGRNAHLIVQPYEWWLPRIWERFTILDAKNSLNLEIMLIVENKDATKQAVENFYRTRPQGERSV